MKINTSELEGAALDWAVAKATGMHVRVDIWALNGLHWPYEDNLSSGYNKRVFPSSDWSQGGPLIDARICSMHIWNDGTYEANVKTGSCTAIGCEGPTYLIAAMRAIVASELGDEVDVPEDLL